MANLYLSQMLNSITATIVRPAAGTISLFPLAQIISHQGNHQCDSQAGQGLMDVLMTKAV